MTQTHKNILITGTAKRVGASCARRLHEQGCNIILHFRSSAPEIRILFDELQEKRPGSVRMMQADLHNKLALLRLADLAEKTWGGLDALVNNASVFYPQPVNEVTESDWDEMLGVNLKAPFFLAQALAPCLSTRQGCIINIIDVHAERGLKDYPVYSIAKAGLAAMTKVLAKELAPQVRVNGIAPGAILWPEQELTDTQKQEILKRVALQRIGDVDDIAKAVSFLITDGDYITGQILTVDGGRNLFC